MTYRCLLIFVEKMTEEQGCSSQSSNTKVDPGWKYNTKDKNDPNSVICNFCNKVTKGGICRAKQHQVGGFKNAIACKKCPPEVKAELAKYMEEKKRCSNSFGSLHSLPELGDESLGDDIDLDGIEEVNEFGKRMVHRKEVDNSSKKSKSISLPNRKGPLDLLMYQKPGKDDQKKGKMKQTNIGDACDKELRARTIQYIARFFYQAGIAFNVARMESFKNMVEAIGRYGPNLKPPSYYELRVPLLKKEVEYTNELLKGHKESWVKYGCSIMSDGWTDKRQRTLINFLVNCPLGTMFVESIDATSLVKSGEQIFEMLDGFVERIGEKNVVQLVTDNGSNCVLAG
jgi:hypothetical protein